MKFAPKTQADLDKDRLLPDGVYDFEVAKAVDKVSQAGNEMIALRLKVFTPSGGERYVRDWLMEKMAFKLRHFAFAVGLGKEYEAGDLTAGHCVGRTGKVRITSKDGKDGYPPSNKVKDYNVPDGVSAQPKPAQKPATPTPQSDDSVPF